MTCGVGSFGSALRLQTLASPVLRDQMLASVQARPRACAQVRRRLRAELLRWHEDKFARFRPRLAPGDAQRVLARVKAVAQLLNSLSSRAQQ